MKFLKLWKPREHFSCIRHGVDSRVNFHTIVFLCAQPYKPLLAVTVPCLLLLLLYCSFGNPAKVNVNVMSG